MASNSPGSSPGLQQYSGRYHLDFVKVYDPSNQAIDVTPLVGEINTSVSIIDPTMVLRITFVDAQNIITKLPIKGGSDVSVQLTYADTTTRYDMKVAEITSMVNFEQQRAYNVVCISRLAYVSGYSKISRSYRGQTSAIAASIFAEWSPDPAGLWDQSVGVQTLVIPNWSPLRTIMWLAKRSRPADIPVHFRFFQDSTGKYHFMPIERALTLYKQAPVAKYTYFKNVTRQAMGNGNERPNTGADTFSIDEIRYGSEGRVFNIIEAFKDNLLYGKMVTTDLYTKSYKEQYYDYFQYYNQDWHANQQPLYRRDTYFPSNIRYSTLAYNSSATRGLNEVDDISNLIKSTLKDYTQSIEIVVKGNSIVDIGQIIDIDIPSPAPKGDPSEKRDLAWSGKYYIVGKRDKYDRGEKITALECIKESMLQGAIL